MAVTTYIVDKDGNQIDASTATVPANRDFRGAWSLSGNVISEDLAKAKDIFRDKVREVRGPLLDAEDVTYMKAPEADDADARSPTNPNSEASAMPNELRWPKIVTKGVKKSQGACCQSCRPRKG